MVSLIGSILAFVFVLSFLVVIHELGHLLVAKLLGVRVEEFGLGYPPRARKLFTKWGTLFSLNWIPFGGFVKLEGEDGPEAEMVEVGKPGVAPVKSGTANTGTAFYEKSRLKRLAIVLAGAGVNFVFGVLALTMYFSAAGIPTVVPAPRIDAIAPHSPADQLHVPVNVEIRGFRLSAESELIATPNQDAVSAFVKEHSGQMVELVTSGPCPDETTDLSVATGCADAAQTYTVYLRTTAETPAGEGSLGVSMVSTVVPHFYPWPEMPLQAAKFGIEQAFTLTFFILQSLGQMVGGLFQGHVPQDVAGPVGIYRQAKQAGFFSHGFWRILDLAGIISLNLAVMNVLPLPALDGGRAFFMLLEMVVGKKRVRKYEGYVNYVGFALLMGLALLITIHDVVAIYVK